jgi:hypothetical protein
MPGAPGAVAGGPGAVPAVLVTCRAVVSFPDLDIPGYCGYLPESAYLAAIAVIFPKLDVPGCWDLFALA